MKNDFKDVMSKKSTEELKKVLSLRDDYQPDAVKAAELELALRNDLNQGDEYDIDDGDDYSFLRKLKSLSDDEVIEIFEKQYLSLRYKERSILNKELKDRNIETKVWYFIKGDNAKKGPYTTTEFKSMASEGEIDYYDYIWRIGLKTWIEAKDVQGLFQTDNFPPRVKRKISGITISEQKVTAGIILSAIILFLTSIFWLIVGISQAGISSVFGNTDMAYTGVWNIIISIACVGFGIGLLSLKKWGYNWGFGTALINTVWFGYTFLFQNASILMFLLFAAELSMLIMIYVNRKQFIKQTEIIGI